jgi:hypothetical protein
MKLAALSLILGSAAAFAPAQTGKVSTALNLDATSQVGVQTPLGFWDPLNYCGATPTDMDEKEFNNLRYVELKHGRCAMLAVVGYLVTAAGVRFPGAEDMPSGFAAIDAMPGMVKAQLFATVFMMEMANGRLTMEGDDFAGTAEFPGDFRNGSLDFGWDKQSDAWKLNKRAIELNNGRAAQMGILGIMVHEKLGNLGEILPGQ